MAGKKQFDVETALDAAMIEFWRSGYADTSVDDLSRATGLNRSSLYGSFGDKDALFLRCLERYATRYGAKYDHALSCAAQQPVAALRAFFDVTLDRIADPDLPDGCLVAHSAMAIPTLSPTLARAARDAVSRQRGRLLDALKSSSLPTKRARTFALHVAAVNQSLAVMSRVGARAGELRDIVDITLDAVDRAVVVS